MDINDYIARLKQLTQAIEQDYYVEYLKNIKGLTSVIAHRVQGSSKNAKGGLFSQYSDTKVQPFMFYPEATRLNKGLNQLKAMQKRGESLSYADFRKLIGKTNSNKNFELSGDMWAKFGITKTDKQSNTVFIGGKSKSSAFKIAANTAREKINIIAPSEEEITLVTNHLEKYLVNLFRKYEVI